MYKPLMHAADDFMQRAVHPTVLSVLLLLPTLCGCELLEFSWAGEKRPEEVEAGLVEAELPDISESLAYRDTVGEQGWVEGLRFMRVRGYGIVAGLGTRGSRECPRQVRDRMVQEMYKRPEFSSRGLEPARISPEQLIDDLDTAVVLIEGEIPAAAPVGSTFDVYVTALPGTQTTSLEGGRLYTAELHIYRDTPGSASVEGRALAIAAGPVFVNPFSGTADAATQRNPREGTVLGGGIVREARRVRFVMRRPSYQGVRSIAETINSRFPSNSKYADAVSPSYINLEIPPRFIADPHRYLALIRHLYLPKGAGFADERAQALAEEIQSPGAPHPDIALAWEGIGRTILPVVEQLYADSQPHARFYAAVTGLRLGDDVAVEVLEGFLRDPESPYRLTAIEELGYATYSYRAAGALRELLNDADPRIRVEAYEALLARQDRLIDTRPVGTNSFALDLVDSTRDNLIYVRRTGDPRIALIGSGLTCLPPVFYAAPDGQITIHANEHDQQLTLVRRTPFANRTSPPLPTSCDLKELIPMLGDDPKVNADGEVHGLAMDYTAVTHALYELCRMRCINASFMLQRPTVTEMFGPLDEPGRQESDL